MRAVEPRPSALPPRVLPQSQHREDSDPDQNRDREQVLDEGDPCPVAQHRDAEVPVDERAVGLDDRQSEDEEAPEDEGVRQAGDGPLEESALSDDLSDLGLEHRAGVDVPAQGRLAAADQPPQPVQAPPGDGQRDDGDEEADEEAHAHTLNPTHQ